jgi:capsid protein
MSDKFDPSVVARNLPWIERAIEAVAPTWGLRRMEARVSRALFDYNAARANRIYNPKTNGSTAESSQTARDRVVMMWEARDLVENYPVAREVPRKVANFLTVTEFSPSTGDKDYNLTVANFFHDWAKTCDITGRHSFKKLVQLAVEHRTVDGDCGFAIRRVKKGLKLQLVPGTLIGDPSMMGVGQIEGYFQGVQVNKFGAPESYRIFKVKDTGVYFDPEDVPADSFVHYFDPFRVDQYRGITDFHAAIRTARMLGEILEAEKIGVRFATQQAALVFSDRGTATTRNLFQPNPSQVMANGQNQQNELTEAGMIRYLGAGDKVEVMPGRPSSAFAGFVDHLMKEIALGVGWPAGVLYGTDNYKGPNVRAEFAAADRVATEKQGILADKVLDPIKDAVILNAIAEGEIEAPKKLGGETMAQALKRATRGEWRFPAKLSIDVGRESAANLNENRQGAKSLQEIAAEEGTDAFSRLDQIAAEAAYVAELAKTHNIPETAIRMITQALPSTPTAAAAAGDATAQAAVKAVADAAPAPSAPPAFEQTKAERIAFALRGPAAHKLSRNSRLVESKTKFAAIRRKIGDNNADAERTRLIFSKLSGLPTAKTEAPQL